MDATLGLYPRGSVFRQLRGCLSITSVKIKRTLDGWFRIGVEMTNHLETIFATIRDCVGTCPCGSMNTWKLKKNTKKSTSYIDLTVSTEGAVTRVALHPHKTWVADHLFCYFQQRISHKHLGLKLLHRLCARRFCKSTAVHKRQRLETGV